MKVLSIIIPTYNTELYIERCLDSLFYSDRIVGALDIIIVNDGGTDGSLAIAKKYQSKYPGSVQIIDKKNGGHGSAVNAGFGVATGKYVRVLDSDDWVDIDNFVEYVERLRTEKSDIVVTDVRRQHLYDESELDFEFSEPENKVIPIEEVETKIMEDDFFFEFSMHSMTVRMEVLRNVWDDGLLEKTFYVDQQFVAKVFMCAKTFTEYHLNIYMYFIGRPEQSMGEGFFNHISDHERVLRWLLATTDDKKLPNYYKKIVSRQVVLMLKTHYLAYSSQDRLTKAKRSELISFDKFLRKHYALYRREAKVESLFKKVANPLEKTKIVKVIRYYAKGKNEQE